MDETFKVVLIGDSGVGKYELLRSLSPSKYAFDDAVLYKGDAVLNKTVSVYGKQMQLQIWNASSSDRYLRLRKMKTRGSLGAVVVYDVTRRDSFERIHQIFTMLDPETAVMLLGNKCDLTYFRRVTKEEGEKLASEKGFRFLETSAKNNINVDEAFTLLAEDILIRQEIKTIEKIMASSDDSSEDLVANAAKAGRKLLANTTITDPKYSLENSTFNKILKFGVEKNYQIRVMLVGNEGVGKSTLLRRLLKMPVKIGKYESTNGIDVHIQSCRVDVETGVWCVNETHEPGDTTIDKLRRYLGVAANTILANKGIAEQSSFHMRVAKMLTNIHVLTRDTIENARGEVSAQMENDSKRETKDANNEHTAARESCDDSGKDNECYNNHTTASLVHPSIDYDDIGTIITQAKSMAKENPQARVDFYDFAGQFVFHASHPTFLSAKAIYILTFDMHKLHVDKRTPNIKEKCDVNQGTVNCVDSILVWLNIVYMFAATKRHIQPQVILVGTHADKLPKASRDQVAEMCFREIRSLLADSPLKHILSGKEFMVDNTKTTDPCFTQLLAEIFELAQQQPDWGVETPARWLPLEREIQYAKDSGLKVLSIAKIRKLNRKLDIQIPDEAGLQMFLEFLHDTGEVIYFNEPTLRDIVVLDPVWLIDALKALITADRFAIRSPKHADKWKRFCETGIIQKATVVAIFKANTDNPTLFENSEHVLKLMEKFLFIASPIDIPDDLEDNRESSKRKDVMYIVPSMVQTPTNKQVTTPTEGLSSTTVFCMVSKNKFLPSAVFHKLLAKCISKWQIVEQGGRKQIFSDVCRFNLDEQKNVKLTIASVQHAIHAWIISYVDTSKPRPELCELVYEFLIESIRNILTSMGVSEEFRTCIQCPRFSPIDSGGYLDTDIMDNQEFITCDECQASHVMQTTDLIDCWTNKAPIIDGEDSITQTQIPTKDNENGEHMEEGHINIAQEPGVEQFLLDVPITQAHLNHARVCNALVTVCADGLRDILQSQIPPGYLDFYGLLRARRHALMTMRNLRQEQLDILFPDPRGRFTGTIDQFDITLLYTLIRNISSVPAPVTGWGKAPVDNPRDTSLGAATERIRICRNCVSGHSMDGRLDDQAFEHYWKDICLIMDDIEQSLGVRGYQDALKKRKDQILSPAEAQSLRAMFTAFQTDVLAAVDLVMEAMGSLKARAENTI